MARTAFNRNLQRSARTNLDADVIAKIEELKKVPDPAFAFLQGFDSPDVSNNFNKLKENLGSIIALVQAETKTDSGSAISPASKEFLDGLSDITDDETVKLQEIFVSFSQIPAENRNDFLQVTMESINNLLQPPPVQADAE
jgi:hypothetical protein